MEPKKILIVEASVETAAHICDCLGSGYHIQVCHNGLSVMGQLNEFRPDVMVMDLALPGLDGIALLKQIALLPCRPRILLTTCFFSRYVETTVSGLGVDLLVLKPCRVEVLTERIQELTQEHEEDTLSVSTIRNCSSITTMLMDLNIPSKRRGFAYLEQVIRLYVEHPGRPLTKAIYPDVARNNYTQPEAVERAIRQVIHESWDKRNDNMWRMYFCSGRDGVIPRPTNAEFISRLAEQYRYTMEDLA